MSEAWADFLKAVDRERKGLAFEEGEDCFFRGHRESAWSLLPTLLRHSRDSGLTTAEDIRALEASLYFEFRSRARELHDQALSQWDILFSMRHHGLATRLLDWTGVLGVAVFFALREVTDESTPCVWLLNPYALNEISWEERDLVAPEYLPQGDYEFSDYLVNCSDDAGFDWNEPVAIYPLQRNARQHAQRGFFTIHGEDLRAIDELDARSFLRRVVLPKEAWADAVTFLENAGIDEFLMFPDLDGLARHLHATHGIR
ncbi:MAG: FRG domain-containing protein [Deltaproteobacteria bacterium]